MQRLFMVSAVVWTLLFSAKPVLAQQQGLKSAIQWTELAEKGEKNLAGANLMGAQLQKADLTGVDLSNANLSGVNLSGANLTGAKLYGSNLTGVNFTGANLTRANFLATNMKYVNLKNADLTQALLQEADLSYAILNGANLSAANLILANLRYSDLQNANLTQALFVYDDQGTAASFSEYHGASAGTKSVKKLPSPEVVETEALGIALEKMETTKTMPVKINGAKMNAKTVGIDIAWAKKQGMVIMP
jgi:hypothetical protein